MIDDEATREFLAETREGLDQLDREFLALEADPTALARIAVVFRIIHTIKGTSGFLGLGKLEKLTHAGESLLALLRDGTAPLTPPVTAALLALVDRVRAVLAEIDAEGKEGALEHGDLMDALNALRVAPARAVAQEAAPLHAATPPDAMASLGGPSDGNVRVDVGLLDKLMNIVGELVLARNQILQVGNMLEDAGFLGASQRLNLITTELQEQVMKTRMQPIGTLWNKLPRVVRDLAVACGKQVRVEMQGKETELDRTILEAVKDPLTHIVRNAVDHGIEDAVTRAAKNKPRIGTLSLGAYQEGGQIIIEVVDDGAGLDLEAIQRKAIERKLVSVEAAARLTEYELAQLIFLPGFSTAAKVTNVSGRGVGMDVVKTNIERIGGTVDISSARGAGTTLKIRIPLTLAIVPALIVQDGGQRYAIPQSNLVELVRVERETAETAIEYVHGAPVYRLRGQLLPVVKLGHALGGTNVVESDAVNIIVLQADRRQFGLIVDEVRDTEEIVVKPLGKELKGLQVYAGATIMGDGRVALILDVIGLAEHSGALVRARSESSFQLDVREERPAGVDWS